MTTTLAEVVEHTNAPSEALSLAERAHETEGLVLKENLSFKNRLRAALHAHRQLHEDTERMEEFLQNIERLVAKARADLEKLDLPAGVIQHNELRTREMMNKDQLQKTFRPHRVLHEKLRQKLLADDVVQIPFSQFQKDVLSSESPVDDWLLQNYETEARVIMETEDDAEVERLCAELKDKVEHDIDQEKVAIPEHLDIPKDMIVYYVNILAMYALGKRRLEPLPKALVDGVLGVMPNEEIMEGIYQDLNRVKDLPEAKNSSFRIIVNGKSIDTYGADNLVHQVEAIRTTQPIARIVHLHQRTDADVAKAIQAMGEGRKIKATSRSGDTPVEVIGLKDGNLKIEGLDVSVGEFLKSPMKFIRHSFSFVEDAHEPATSSQ